MRGTVSLAACISVALVAAPPARALPPSDVDRLQAEYRAAAAKLAPHIDGSFLKEEAAGAALLARSWELAEEWLVAWLDARDGETAEEIEAALARLPEPTAYPEPGDCLALGKGTWLVMATGPFAHAFVVTTSSDGRHHRVSWTTTRPGGAPPAALEPWRAASPREDGRHMTTPTNMGRLPDDRAGRPRFFLEADYSQDAGATRGTQLTVWRWEGERARLLVARDYCYTADQEERTRVDGDRLIVQQKKSFLSFFACGSCEGRQTDWTLQLTPDGVKDLGERSLVSDTDVIDALFDAVIHGRPAGAFGTPGALRTARRLVSEARAQEPARSWKAFPSLGMIEGWSSSHHGDERHVCLSLAPIGAQLYVLRPRRGRVVVTSISPASDGCGPPDERAPRAPAAAAPSPR